MFRSASIIFLFAILREEGFLRLTWQITSLEEVLTTTNIVGSGYSSEKQEPGFSLEHTSGASTRVRCGRHVFWSNRVCCVCSFGIPAEVNKNKLPVSLER